MVLGLENVKGLGFLKDFDIATFASGIGRIVAAIFIFGLVAGVIFIYLWKKSDKQKYDKKIHWFEEVNGQMVPTGDDNARELTIPNTNVKVFFIKSKKLYLPRGNKRMGKNSYWYCIRNNQEIVNFSMKNLNVEMAEADLDFDHTDMRYAKENLFELIRRNYREHSKPWWKEYKDVIATVVFIFVMSLAFYFLLAKTGQLIDKVGVLIDKANQAQVACIGSGVK